MSRRQITLFLCGDVMTGRGVDQILPHPSEPHLSEPALRDAREYVWLAEQANGPIEPPVPFDYIWGDALAELERRRPDARLVNLETAITRNANPWRPKDVHYRMHPANVACLTDAHIDACALANNHALDYGRAGLVETLDVLALAGIETAGAGRTVDEARRPAIVPLSGGGRLLIFAFAARSCGVPAAWAADGAAGVELLPDLSERTAHEVAARISRRRRGGDLVIASIHWGPNWGWEVADDEVRFAHQLIDGGVDLVHGHSSHHPRPIERYQGRLILYGCGDFIDDYEGISGHEEFRDELRLMYFATLDAETGVLEALQMVPLRARRMRLWRAAAADRDWLRETLDRLCRPFDTRVELGAEGELRLGGLRRTVRSVMSAPVQTIDADARVEAAARRLRDANVGILPVVEGGAVVGVVTDRDLVVRVLAAGRDPTATAVREVMTAGVVACREDDDLPTVAARMVRSRVRRLIVVGRDGALAGVVSVDDLATLGARPAAAAAEAAQPGGPP